jgi:hypothetical protein
MHQDDRGRGAERMGMLREFTVKATGYQRDARLAGEHAAILHGTCTDPHYPDQEPLPWWALVKLYEGAPRLEAVHLEEPPDAPVAPVIFEWTVRGGWLQVDGADEEEGEPTLAEVGEALKGGLEVMLPSIGWSDEGSSEA